jgi:hypothetical protein
MPMILLFCIVGSFAINNTMFGVIVMVVAGVVAFYMERWGFPVAPTILGVVLGTMLEEHFFSSLVKADGRRFVDPDVNRQTGIVRGVDGRRRRADVDGREPSGIAVREYVEAFAGEFAGGDGLEERQPGDGDAAIERDILVADFHRQPAGGVGPCGSRKRRYVRTHAVERPAQIHGGGTRREQGGVGVRETGVRVIRPQCEPHAPSRGRADQRGAANQHGANRMRGVVEGTQPRDDEGVRQSRLVDDLDRLSVGGGPDRAGGAAGDVHGCDHAASGRSVVQRRSPPAGTGGSLKQLSGSPGCLRGVPQSPSGYLTAL